MEGQKLKLGTEWNRDFFPLSVSLLFHLELHSLDNTVGFSLKAGSTRSDI